MTGTCSSCSAMRGPLRSRAIREATAARLPPAIEPPGDVAGLYVPGLGHVFERHDRVDRGASAAYPRVRDAECLDAARILRHGVREKSGDLRIDGHERSAPFPRTTRPGRASVCSPSNSTGVPLTSTCRMPVAYWCGCSYVARSWMVAG